MRSGRRLGVVDRRDGQRELVVSDADDPDACAVSLSLTGSESDALAELLGAPRIGKRLARLRSDAVLAGVTAVSSSGIVAKLLSDLGRLGNRETPTVLSILVLEDLGMAV